MTGLAPPTGDLTDDFFRNLAAAYRAAVDRRERPNQAIARELGVSVRTVAGWVYLARQRGIMPRGNRGRVDGWSPTSANGKLRLIQDMIADRRARGMKTIRLDDIEAALADTERNAQEC